MTKTTPMPAVGPRQRGAHLRSVSIDQNDALRTLAAALGMHVVTTIFNKDVRTIERWLKSGSATMNLKTEDERRLRHTFHVFSLVEGADDANVARAWFLGMNPNLTTRPRSNSSRPAMHAPCSSQPVPT